ncbi:MAG: N-acyl homoserine lactonase family protein [Chloroflexota bacterium]
MTNRPEIIALELGTFRFPEPELAHRQGVVMGYAIRHRGGIFLFDTGLGFGNEELEERYHPVQRPIGDALDEVGIALADVTAVANCHLHADHAGQNSAFPEIPIYVQASEWEIAHTTEHTVLEWIDFPGSRYVQLGGDHEPFEGLRIVATPGHTPGHQSLAVETDQGLAVLVGQAVYTVDEWAGERDELEGRSSAPDRDAYDRSTERLHALQPASVHFGHDRRSWRRAGPDVTQSESGYPS